MTSSEDIQKQVEVDRLLSSANAYRVKGNLLAAEDACRHALALDPANLRAGEMLGDFLRENGKLREALDQFRSLLETDNSLVSVEKKFAGVTLEIADQERERREIQEYLANPQQRAQAKRSAGIALALSLVAPGFGQIYLGEIVKGAIITAAFFFSLIVVAASPGTGLFLRQLISVIILGSVNPGNPLAPIQWPSVWLVFFIGVGLFSYIFSAVDAPIVALKREKRMQEKAEQQSAAASE